MLFNPSLFPVYTTNGTGFYPLPKVLATGVTNANTGIYVFDTLFVADAPQQTIATALVMSPNTLNYGAPLTVMGYRSINIGSDIDNQNTITTTSGHIGGIAGYGIGDNYGLMGIIGYDELGNIPIVHIGGGCWETYESARQIKFNTSLDGASEGNDQWEINENGQFLGLAATSCIITPAPISCNSVTNNGVVWLSNLPTNGNPSLWTAGLKNGSILCTTNGQMFVMSNGVALGPK